MRIEPLLYSRKDAAKALSISPRSLDYLVADGRLKVRRIGGRVLIAADVLQRFAGKDDTQKIVPVLKKAA